MRKVHWFIFDHRKKYPVKKMCSSLSVNESGYYKWLRNGERPKKWQNLLVEIHRILDKHPDNDNYGINRMHTALEQEGIITSKSSVRRAMHMGNLLHQGHRSPDGLTKADKKAMRPANIIQRNFDASAPNEKWLTDITQIQCRNGKLYIAPVFDCYGGEIISLAMDTNMKKELCISALDAAFNLRGHVSGVIVHSDAGSQYTSSAYKSALGKHHAVQSMSDVGKCYDNCRMESFFATLKKEKLYRIDTAKMSVEKVKSIVFNYVMVYYNRQRISTVNPGGWPPSIYREKTAETAAAA